MTTQAATEDEVRLAIEAGQRRQMTERRATGVRYNRLHDAVEIELADKARLRLPRSLVREFRDVLPADMAGLRVSAAGYAIALDAYDISISVHGLNQ